ncbi:hypothetical protein BsWGS_13917 [Bradybaena similaris]
MDNNHIDITPPPSTCKHHLSKEERHMMDVLNLKMMDVRGINEQIHAICLYLCEDENLREFSGVCGHNQRDWMLYDAMVKNRPGRLPSKTFLEVYFENNENVTLRDFMRILLNMTDKQLKIHDLLKVLWNAALYSNSQYFRNMQEKSCNH